MNLTSTLLKVDVAVLSTILGVMVVFYKCLREVQAEAVEAAKERTRIEQSVEFHGQRLDSLENWRAAISEIRRQQ